MEKPVPPKIAPKPGQVMVVRAMYNYTAQQEDELSFTEGDVLYISDQMTDKNWWKAKCGLKSGLIPSNYVELKSEVIQNPIIDCARRGNLSFLQECLKNGVSPTCLDSSGNSPLHWACRAGHLEVTQEIIRYASKQSKEFINVQNKLGDTPLLLGSMKGHLEIVKLLLENSANPVITNKDGKNALEMTTDPHIKGLLQSAILCTIENEQEAETYLDDDEDENDED